MFSSLGRYIEVFTALCLSHVKRREELGWWRGAPVGKEPPEHNLIIGSQCAARRRLCSNIAGILGCIRRTSERKDSLGCYCDQHKSREITAPNNRADSQLSSYPPCSTGGKPGHAA